MSTKRSSPIIDLDAIRAAREVGRSVIEHTPVTPSAYLSQQFGGKIILKAENLQRTGSFKIRGALNKVHRLGDLAKNGVVSGSAGNHAQGVAFAARKMGCQAHIFLPKRTPLVKLDATERLGAHVYLVGDFLEEAFEAALAFSVQENAHFLHAFNDFEIILGQASCALEVVDQFAQVSGFPGALPDYFFCSIGGGGLAGGVGLGFHHFSPLTLFPSELAPPYKGHSARHFAACFYNSLALIARLFYVVMSPIKPE